MERDAAGGRKMREGQRSRNRERERKVMRRDSARDEKRGRTEE